MFLAFMIAPVFQIVNIGTQLTEAFAGLDRIREIKRLITPKRVIGEFPQTRTATNAFLLKRLRVRLASKCLDS